MAPAGGGLTSSSRGHAVGGQNQYQQHYRCEEDAHKSPSGFVQLELIESRRQKQIGGELGREVNFAPI